MLSRLGQPARLVQGVERGAEEILSLLRVGLCLRCGRSKRGGSGRGEGEPKGAVARIWAAKQLLPWMGARAAAPALAAGVVLSDSAASASPACGARGARGLHT
jgi:hypothetical protein